MTIKKYAHACLLVEKDGVGILIDPGSWNETPDATGVAALLITHEHQDHYEPGQVKAIAANNPGLRIITHAAVTELLAKEGIEAETIEPGQAIDVNGVSVESVGTEHAPIYGPSPCRNTGFLIGGELFVPGDALHDVPDRPVRILALPTGGPWMKVGEAVEYTKRVHPEVAFAIHDAMHTDDYARGFMPSLMNRFLDGTGIEFVDLPPGAIGEF